MNNWLILLIAVLMCGALVSIFLKVESPFNNACQLSLFIGLAYIIMHYVSK